MKLVRCVIASVGVAGLATATGLDSSPAGASVPAAGMIRYRPALFARNATKSTAPFTSSSGRMAASCRFVRYTGSAGYIAVQTSPAGTVAWDIYMNSPVDRVGFWTVSVYVGRKQVDHKAQDYEPHASVPASEATPGSIFSIKATMTNENGDFESVPNGCVIP